MLRTSNLALAIIGLALLLGSGRSWAGPPPCAGSDGTDSTACGSNALENNSGEYNTAIGYSALWSNTTGDYNTASGVGALAFSISGNDNTAGGYQALYLNTTGGDNTASGAEALALNTTGSWNTAGGSSALYSNTTGSYNTAGGYDALYGNTTGNDNTASGVDALFFNTTGGDNTASGYEALNSNTTGGDNTATGSYALAKSTTANGNTASGFGALFLNTTGGNNTASGIDALYSNTTGIDNIADGGYALYNATTGDNNTASGYQALLDTTTGGGNTAFGANAGAKNVLGRNNTFIGFDARPNRGNYANGTAIGYNAVLTASNSIVLGDTGISKIYAEVSSITAISDRRRKKDIAPLGPDLGLAFIEKLKPVSYRYNNGDETQRYGFIAQDLEQALPATLHDTVETSQPEHGLALIERQNDQARTYRVAYGELTAPMVAAIQQQQSEFQGQQQEIAVLKAENAELRRAQATADDAMLRAQKEQAAENATLRQSLEALKQQVGAMTLARNSSVAN